ncbi:hypothetical protein BCR36DRAFT_403890 [Piromyces finnis]|uniref:Uncharacterized protein n=1 Tax=Piromyces finnis TaxID=1754191 RepID=A0A1Y1VCC3_9FUNG|nr:hypothetical protein BCR36DRAFT_403890 [Piromyces finnis]|eukprot:ORX52122.1 hypothetical protein BCR36DRAFT_403890 [Piromyces finnis]
MKCLYFIAALLFLFHVHSVYSQHLENFNNEENPIIIEWVNDKSGKCQTYSIYEDDVLLKSNIPIINNKVDAVDLHHKHGKLILKCDSYVKQKRTIEDDKGETSLLEENSLEESDDTDDDSLIDSIDNIYTPSDEKEEEEKGESLFEKIFKINKVENKNKDGETESNPITNNKNDSSKNNKENNSYDNSDDDKSGKDGNNQDKTNVDDDNKNSSYDTNNRMDLNKDTTNNNENKNDENDGESKDYHQEKGNNDNDNGKGDNDKLSIESEKDDKDINPIQLGVGVSLSFLLTSGMFLSVMKIRKMSELQLEVNAQEMSANSVYIPSPRISNSGSMSLSMSSLELGNAASLHENSFTSTLNSIIV